MTNPNNTTAFATKFLELIQRTRTSSTYKYAVIMALVEICQEQFNQDGRAPDVVTTRQLATHVLETYWRQVRTYSDSSELLQNNGNQALILNRISDFREEHPEVASPFMARRVYPKDFVRLLNKVEWKLIEAPLPRLQRVGDLKREFLYSINWDVSDVRKQKRASGVSAYQRRFGPDEPGEAVVSTEGFDNRILLKPGVGDHLVRLAPLIRPLIRREWTGLVAQLNELESEELERFLFRPQREQLAGLSEPLKDIQGGKCFYCEKGMRGTTEVDHFIAWSRHPHDDIYNLVAAHEQCNRQKSHYLAAPRHVRKWCERFDSAAEQRFEGLADETALPADHDVTLAIGRSNYLPLPDGTPLWLKGRSKFVAADSEELNRIFESVA